jgi:hypothetical protein
LGGAAMPGGGAGGVGAAVFAVHTWGTKYILVHTWGKTYVPGTDWFMSVYIGIIL